MFGDFWVIPAMIAVMRRLIADDGGIGPALDKILHEGSPRYQWAAASASAPPRSGGAPQADGN